ncbi:MAG: sulfatase-like hydrolase/transferase [Acidobacteriota bacterium]
MIRPPSDPVTRSFVRVGLAVGLVENLVMVRAYDLAFTGPLDAVLFLVAFTAAAGLMWGLAGGVASLLLRRVVKAPRGGGRSRLAVAAFLWVVVCGHGVLIAGMLVRDVADTPARQVAAAALALAGSALVVWLGLPARQPARRRLPAPILVMLAALLITAWGMRLAGRETSVAVPERLAVPRHPVVAGPAGRGVEGPRLPGGTNVVLIVLDTLRADHLSLAGYPRSTSPITDALAASGVHFTQVITQATRTSPNMASMLTGTTPYSHGIIRSRSVLDDRLLTWAEILAAAGYQNLAVVANPNMGRRFGFTQGIDDVTELFDGPPGSDAAAVYSRAMDRLDAGIESPFFLWLHPIDPHAPYAPPAPYDTFFAGDPLHPDRQGIDLEFTALARDGGIHPGARLGDLTRWGDFIARYDGEIRYADLWLGKFLAALDRLHLRENTLIVFTSDHGESLGEHRYFFAHGTYTYDATARVPLVLSHPDLPSNRTVTDLVRTVDILPSVLEMLGVPVPPVIEGESFLPMIDAPEAARPGRVAPISSGTSGYVTLAARDAYHKVILTPQRWGRFDGLLTAKLSIWPGAPDSIYRHRSYRTELYDLGADPDETINLAGQEGTAGAHLALALTGWMDSARSGYDAVRPTLEDLDPALRERLRSLGYIE